MIILKSNNEEEVLELMKKEKRRIQLMTHVLHENWDKIGQSLANLDEPEKGNILKHLIVRPQVCKTNGPRAYMNNPLKRGNQEEPGRIDEPPRKRINLPGRSSRI